MVRFQLVYGLLMMGLCLIPQQVVPSTDEAVQVRVLVPRDSVRHVTTLLGFNQEFLAAMGGAEQRRPAWGQSKIRLTLQNLAPSILRFPGGTVSNFYNWRTGQLSGPINHPGLMKHAHQYDAMSADQHGFMELCNSIGAEPLFVANLYQRGLPGADDWMRSLLDQSGKSSVRYWELGNEMNLHAWHPGLTWVKRPYSVEEYIRRAQPVGRALLALDPTVLVAVNADAPEYVFRADSTLHDFLPGSHWNRSLVEATRFFNAVSMHVYVYHHPWWQATDLERVQWLFAAGDELPPRLEAWHRRFFDGFPLWLTEFGVTGRDAVEQRYWGYVLPELNALLQVLAAPGPVTMILKHLAFSQGTGRVAFQYRRHQEEEMVSWTAGGVAYQWIAQALLEARELVKISFDEVGVFPGHLRYAQNTYPVLSGISLSGEGRQYLFFINRGSELVSLRMPSGSWKGVFLSGSLKDEVVKMIKPVEAKKLQTTWELPGFAFAMAVRMDIEK